MPIYAIYEDWYYALIFSDTYFPFDYFDSNQIMDLMVVIRQGCQTTLGE